MYFLITNEDVHKDRNGSAEFFLLQLPCVFRSFSLYSHGVFHSGTHFELSHFSFFYPYIWGPLMVMVMLFIFINISKVTE